MNDRFKFRVWYKSVKAFQFGAEVFLAEVIDDNDAIIEQCTGLKDKNGKLIYENDLIKCPSGLYRIAVDDFGLWTAIYKNNPFEGVAEWSDIVKNYVFNQSNVEIEVLGNIHENADLIKVGGK